MTDAYAHHEVLKERALTAARELADYASYNETMEDAFGESKIAIDRATFQRVKADQAVKALEEFCK